MKNMKIDSLLTTLLLFVAGAFMYSCSPDAGEEIGPISKESKTTVGLCNCKDVDLVKVAGEGRPDDINGIVRVCQDTENIYVTFSTTDNGANAIIRTRVGIFELEPSSLNPSNLRIVENLSPLFPTVYTETIPIDGRIGTIYIAALATLEKSGPNWAQGGPIVIPEMGNPNSRYFSYMLQACSTPPPPTNACSFSQGFWFAKPNVIWPESYTELCPEGGTVTIGNHTYCKEDARKIFRSSNKNGMTDAKMAFLQASTIKLSIASGKNITDIEVLSALILIDNYFKTNNTRASDGNINDLRVFPKNTPIRNAATTITNYIRDNHCDRTPS